MLEDLPDSSEHSKNRSILDAIDLGLRLDYTFFDTILKGDSPPQKQYPSNNTRECAQIVVGRWTMSLAREYLPDGLSCPPVLLIVESPGKIRYSNEVPENIV